MGRPPPRRPLTARTCCSTSGGGKCSAAAEVGVDPRSVEAIARQIAEVVASGVQMAVVIGGGNFFRGEELQQGGMDRARADYMGMLGTVMNCLALQDFLEREGSTPGSRRRSRWVRSPSPTSRAAPSGTWRRAAL